MAHRGTEESAAVVMDFGSGYCKVGFAGDDEPMAIFRTVVGRRRSTPSDSPVGKLPAKECNSEGREFKGSSGVHTAEIFVGAEQQDEADNEISWSFPVARGVTIHWEEMEDIWHHAYWSKLQVSPQNQPVHFTEPPLQPKAIRERWIVWLFEKLQVPGLSVYVTAVLALYASGRTTGCVVECGEGVTHVVPIYEGYILPHAVIRRDVAGQDVTDALIEMMKLNHQKDEEETKGGRHPPATAIEKRHRWQVERWKEKECCVALDFDKELERLGSGGNDDGPEFVSYGTPFKLPREARFACAEILFRAPHMMPDSIDSDGQSDVGIANATWQAVESCDEVVRKDILNNVVLAGGTTLLPGFAARLRRELEVRMPPSLWTHLKVVPPPERRFSAWIGGSILASLSVYGSSRPFVTRGEYLEVGPQAVHRRCY